jgi:cytochrome b6-f complex iron-sulfur subunit
MTGETQRPTDDTFARRTFLSHVWLWLGVAATGQTAFIGLRYFGSRTSDSPFGTVINAGRPDDFLPGTITLFPEARFALVRFDDSGFLALYTKCTHLACVVSWDDDAGRFTCPCHGSEFDRHGDVLNAPAPRPLDRFPLSISRRKIEVDTGNPVRRSSVSTDDLTYFVEE